MFLSEKEYFCIKHKKVVHSKQAYRSCMHNRKFNGQCPNLGQRDVK